MSICHRINAVSKVPDTCCDFLIILSKCTLDAHWAFGEVWAHFWQDCWYFVCVLMCWLLFCVYWNVLHAVCDNVSNYTLIDWLQWLRQTFSCEDRAPWSSRSYICIERWCSCHGWGCRGSKSRLSVCALTRWSSVISNALHLAWRGWR